MISGRKAIVITIKKQKIMTREAKELIEDLTNGGEMYDPIISVAGRKYYIAPYQGEVCIPQELVDAVKRHPERDDVKRTLQHYAEVLLSDIVSYLRDAIAVTVIEEESDGDVHQYKLLLPVMMPADTIVRWYDDGDIKKAKEREARRRSEAEERMKTGKPYIFNLMEWDEDKKKFINPIKEAELCQNQQT